MIYISSRFEYDFYMKHGFLPLKDWRKFSIENSLRVNIQKELFGSASFQTENQKYYKWVWANSKHFCEETGQPLHYYSAVHISHIITKGADRRMATDPRNVNLLTYQMHTKWEIGNRKEMNIYNTNKLIINILKKDYV